MALINIQNLTFSYEGSDKNIFEKVSFQIDTNWKLGMVGRNGRGKTTFLNLLLGNLEYEGNISANVKFTYFPFEVKNPNRNVIEILYDICPIVEEWEIIREFSYLNFDYDTLYKNFSNLSNGEKTKVLLAGLFLKDNNYLLIDEPTNHLDSDGRKVVANYLKNKKNFILVSHDRNFLDSTVNHILAIYKSSITVTQGNFSSWFENYNQRQISEQAQNEELKKEIARLSKAAKQTADWSNKIESTKYGNGPVDRGFIGHKSAKMMKRAKATENRQNKIIEQKSALLKDNEQTFKLKIENLEYRKRNFIQITDLQIEYDNTPICKPINLYVNQGDRILLDGKNGCGKSSLLKIILKQSSNYIGTLNIPNDLIISYIPQSYDTLQGNITDFAKDSKIDEALFRAILDKMGFEKQNYNINMQYLSAGQKKKILIAKSLSQKAHLYVWDEPLNYLDIFSRIQLEELLSEYSPTMIFVEHDTAFQNLIATKIYKIE